MTKDVAKIPKFDREKFLTAWALAFTHCKKYQCFAELESCYTRFVDFLEMIYNEKKQHLIYLIDHDVLNDEAKQQLFVDLGIAGEIPGATFSYDEDHALSEDKAERVNAARELMDKLIAPSLIQVLEQELHDKPDDEKAATRQAMVTAYHQAADAIVKSGMPLDEIKNMNDEIKSGKLQGEALVSYFKDLENKAKAKENQEVKSTGASKKANDNNVATPGSS